MSAGDGFLSQLCLGLVQHLAATVTVQGMPLEWRPTGPPYGKGYNAGVGLFIGEWPTDPDRVLCLTPYAPAGGEDEQVRVRVQMRMRWPGGNPLAVLDLLDAVQDELDERTLLRLPTGVTIGRVGLLSSASLGQDSAKRWSWTSNYELDADRPRA